LATIPCGPDSDPHLFAPKDGASYCAAKPNPSALPSEAWGEAVTNYRDDIVAAFHHPVLEDFFAQGTESYILGLEADNTDGIVISAAIRDDLGSIDGDVEVLLHYAQM